MNKSDDASTRLPESGLPLGRFRRDISLDLAIVFLIAATTHLICGRVRAFDQLAAFVERHDNWEFDELFVVGNVLLIAAIGFFVRRYREVRLLLRERDVMLGELRASEELVKKGQEEMRLAALTDSLTGLPNRASLMKLLATMEDEFTESDPRLTALFFLDMDRFKQINDLHGHQVGDLLLSQVAKRVEGVLGIQASTPANVERTVVRLGGDEFVAVVRDLEGMSELEELASQLLQALSRRYDCNGAVISTHASIGVAIQEVASTELLLADADTAMYEAKKRGRGNFVVFERQLRKSMQRRSRLEEELGSAIEKQQLHLVYHPIVSLSDGSVEAVEVLLRWIHPELGEVSPSEFLPIAEESELIYDLGVWVLESALQQMKLWIDEHGRRTPEVVSINVSRKQFDDPDFVQRFASSIQNSHVPPQRIQLEIIEDLHSSDVDAIVEKMAQLKELGVRIAIDDFGAGTSTFATINRFPLDTLKVDMSLVSQIVTSVDGASIIHSLAILVRNLGLRLIAEGVENAQQAAILRDLGCPSAQGFLFSQPLPAEEVSAHFENSPAERISFVGANQFPQLWSEKLTEFHNLLGE